MAGTVAVAMVLFACDVESPATSGGGLSLEGSSARIRGFAVVGSDFSSTSVSLLGVDGQLQSGSFISSASTDPGLSAALGGDVVLPTMTMTGDELVLIDRLPGSVLTWVDLQTAEVRAQLSVATGFSSNPHDYVPVAPDKAFVPRFEPNLASGVEPFDGGNDLLVVDPSSASIVDRIDLTPALAGEPGGYYPRAERALLAGGQLRVLAVGINADFTDSVDSRLISIDPDTHALGDVLVFDGMRACSGARIAPGGERLAIACNGAFGTDPALGFPDSGVILVDLAGGPAGADGTGANGGDGAGTDGAGADGGVESARWTAADLGTGAINQVAWLDETHLALLTFGRFNPDGTQAEASDEARTLDVVTGSVGEPWLTGGPFTLGDIACSVEAGACIVADAETDGGVVHTVVVGPEAELRLTGTVRSDPASGLPPRSIGTF